MRQNIDSIILKSGPQGRKGPISRQSLDSAGLDLNTGRTFLMGLFFVAGVGMTVSSRAGKLLEVVGILDGSGDFVVSAGPLAEVEDAAAVGAEGEILVGGDDYFATGGAEEGF